MVRPNILYWLHKSIHYYKLVPMTDSAEAQVSVPVKYLGPRYPSDFLFYNTLTCLFWVQKVRTTGWAASITY